MPDNDEGRSRRHTYPPFWDRFVPIAVAIIAVLVLALLAVIVGVALGLLPS